VEKDPVNYQPKWHWRRKWKSQELILLSIFHFGFCEQLQVGSKFHRQHSNTFTIKRLDKHFRNKNSITICGHRHPHTLVVVHNTLAAYVHPTSLIVMIDMLIATRARERVLDKDTRSWHSDATFLYVQMQMYMMASIPCSSTKSAAAPVPSRQRSLSASSANSEHAVPHYSSTSVSYTAHTPLPPHRPSLRPPHSSHQQSSGCPSQPHLTAHSPTVSQPPLVRQWP